MYDAKTDVECKAKAKGQLGFLFAAFLRFLPGQENTFLFLIYHTTPVLQYEYFF